MLARPSSETRRRHAAEGRIEERRGSGGSPRTVRVQSGRKPFGERLRDRLSGLGRLPIRPHTARVVMEAFSTTSPEGEDADPSLVEIKDGALELDPGWVAAGSASPLPKSPLHLVAESSWWPSALASGQCAEAIQRLWRHSLAAALACRSLARERGDPDPDQLVRAGLLHGLARWAVAAVDPEWIAGWMDESNLRARRRREIADLGADLGEIGRRLAERWGCEPLVVDAAWLHGEADGALNEAAREPERLALIQEAVRWADATPWSLSSAAARESVSSEPRLRILIAEVQSKCGSMFASVDSTLHEERMTRENARLRLRIIDMDRNRATQARLIDALSEAPPDETPESWSARTGRIWCGEPEVNAARVIWLEPGSESSGRGSVVESATTFGASPTGEEGVPAKAPSWTIPLESRGARLGEIQLWLDPEQEDPRPRLETTGATRAWRSWAARVADRSLFERRLQAVVGGSRGRVEDERDRLESAKLEALAEFAAGAGHELNNPLAVIAGRAQLLLGQTDDPETSRSLKILLAQTQRAHQILRDLMFVARPAEPRPGLHHPAEVLASCLDEFRVESEARGVRLVGEFEGREATSWIDPEALRHIAEALIRNALQASSSGQTIQARLSLRGRELRLKVVDGGKGITSVEGERLFDPFFSGRQAGRGLGLGLPRAARLIAMAGGSIDWSSAVGGGSIFQVRLPSNPPPDEPKAKSA